MADKYFTDSGEKIEVISYQPSIQDSGDLEPGTKTITVTSKPGTPDYSVDLTVPAPDDARFVVKRVGVRLQLTVDSMTAGHLYGSIHVNGAERRTFDLTAAGTAYIVQDLVEGQFEVGGPDSFQVFLWVDSGQAVISLCQLWQAVGSTDTGYNFPFCLQVMHEGLMQLFTELNRAGTGNIEARIGQGTGARPSMFSMTGGLYGLFTPPLMLSSNNGISLRATNAGDLGCFFSTVKAILRNER